MSETTGGEVIARMLQNEGVEKVFGIIDCTYFGFYAALVEESKSGTIRGRQINHLRRALPDLLTRRM